MDQATNNDRVCLNCSSPLSGAFCHDCGQSSSVGLGSISEWFQELWSSFFSFDWRWLRTLGAILFEPGRATLDFAAGKRVSHVPPLRLYILTSAVSIALMSFGGFFTPENWGLTELDPPAGFGSRLRLFYPFINLLSPVALALVLAVVYRRHFFQLHFTFALHLWTFLVALGTPITLLPLLDPPVSVIVTINVVMILLAVAYLLRAMGRVYGGPADSLLPRVAAVLVGLIVSTVVLSMAAVALALAAS